MQNIKVVFMGTPEFSVPVLEGLIENYDVIGVVTQPDKKVGRKQEIKFSSVKEVALKNNIKILQPEKIRTDYNSILELNPDIIITCAYGQIIPEEILNYPKYGCINVHASLLPKLRGGAPIHKSIIYGYDKTGITIMYMDKKMDSGDIISQEEIKIEDNFNTGVLHDKLSIIGKELLLKTLPHIISGDIKPVKQVEEEVTYAWNVSKEEEIIDFDKTTREVFNQIRGLNPFPGAYSILDDKVIKIYECRIGNNKSTNPGEIIEIYNDGIGVSTKDGEIIITKIKPFGKKMMDVKDYLNGIKDKKELLKKRFEDYERIKKSI
ncbi:MAG: methionyl-tRNA formyltransferase [Firmicutes bacterium]|nr:methionyl-tRNA formyltransferase [Bacillota bacterium]